MASSITPATTTNSAVAATAIKGSSLQSSSSNSLTRHHQGYVNSSPTTVGPGPPVGSGVSADVGSDHDWSTLIGEGSADATWPGAGFKTGGNLSDLADVSFPSSSAPYPGTAVDNNFTAQVSNKTDKPPLKRTSSLFDSYMVSGDQFFVSTIDNAATAATPDSDPSLSFLFDRQQQQTDDFPSFRRTVKDNNTIQQQQLYSDSSSNANNNNRPLVGCVVGDDGSLASMSHPALLHSQSLPCANQSLGATPGQTCLRQPAQQQQFFNSYQESSQAFNSNSNSQQAGTSSLQQHQHADFDYRSPYQVPIDNTKMSNIPNTEFFPFVDNGQISAQHNSYYPQQQPFMNTFSYQQHDMVPNSQGADQKPPAAKRKRNRKPKKSSTKLVNSVVDNSAGNSSNVDQGLLSAGPSDPDLDQKIKNVVNDWLLQLPLDHVSVSQQQQQQQHQQHQQQLQQQQHQQQLQQQQQLSLQRSQLQLPIIVPPEDKYRYCLLVPISSSARIGKECLGYINRSQLYKLTGKAPLQRMEPQRQRVVYTNLVISLLQTNNEPKCWYNWYVRQKKALEDQRINAASENIAASSTAVLPSHQQLSKPLEPVLIELDTSESSNVTRNNIEELAVNAFRIRWPLAYDGNGQFEFLLRFNCLSTDFCSLKGIKGIPLRISVDTYEDDKLVQRSYAQVKVFSEKGAERKIREEHRRRHQTKMPIDPQLTKYLLDYHFYSSKDLASPFYMFHPDPKVTELLYLNNDGEVISQSEPNFGVTTNNNKMKPNLDDSPSYVSMYTEYAGQDKPGPNQNTQPYPSTVTSAETGSNKPAVGGGQPAKKKRVRIRKRQKKQDQPAASGATGAAPSNQQLQSSQSLQPDFHSLIPRNAYEANNKPSDICYALTGSGHVPDHQCQLMQPCEPHHLASNSQADQYQLQHQSMGVMASPGWRQTFPPSFSDSSVATPPGHLPISSCLSQPQEHQQHQQWSAPLHNLHVGLQQSQSLGANYQQQQDTTAAINDLLTPTTALAGHMSTIAVNSPTATDANSSNNQRPLGFYIRSKDEAYSSLLEISPNNRTLADLRNTLIGHYHLPSDRVRHVTINVTTDNGSVMLSSSLSANEVLPQSLNNGEYFVYEEAVISNDPPLASPTAHCNFDLHLVPIPPATATTPTTGNNSGGN